MWSVAVLLFLSCVYAHTLGQQPSAGSCELQHCTPSTESLSAPFTNEEDAILDARCLLACVEEVVPNNSSPVSTILASTSCDNVEVIMECRRGCVTRGRNTNLSVNQCEIECHNSCTREVSNCSATDPCSYKGSKCIKNCTLKQHCGRGCTLYSDTLNSTNNTGTPTLSAPSSSPTLTQQDAAGVFEVSSTSGGGADSSNTTRIFRVEGSNSETYFVVQASLRDPLELGYFACREVNVSFATVGTHGISAFSPATEVAVHGEERFPSQVNVSSITFPVIEEDTRPGFLGRAVLHISWARPKGCEYLTHYLLYIYSQGANCGGIGELHKFTIDRESTGYTVQAQNPDDVPSFGSIPVFGSCQGCLYQIFMQSYPVRVRSDRSGVRVKCINSVTQPPALMNISCHKFVNETTGNIAFVAIWEIKSENISLQEHTLEAINHYDVNIFEGKRLTEGRPLLPFQSITLAVRCNESLFSSRINDEYYIGVAYCIRNNSGDLQIIGLRPVSNPKIQYHFRLSPIKNQTLFWRQIPSRQECSIDALPEPPAAVNMDNITVSDLELNGTGLSLNVSWLPPTKPFGEIQQYQVRVGVVPLSSEEQEGNITRSSHVNSTNDTSIVLTTEEFYIDDETLCLYVQIRSQNLYLWSNWSEPVPVPKNESVLPNCTYKSSGGMSLPLFVYIIIGVVIFAVFLLFLCTFLVFLGKHLHRRWQIQNSFKDKGFENLMWAMGKTPDIPEASLLGMLRPWQLEDEWELPPQNVVLEEELGEGCFGKVLKGFVKGPIASSRVMKNSIYETVAIKFLKTSASPNERRDFLNEIDMMKKIAKGNNPHVVRLIGCVTTREPLCLITDLLKYGDLLSYLHAIRKLVLRKLKYRKNAIEPAANDDPTPEPYLEPQNGSGLLPVHSDSDAINSSSDAVTPAPDSLYADLGEVEPVNLISFAYQIASGMEYLSSLDIVHRDLACRNILVGEGKKLKISDFGMSRMVEAEDPIYVKTSTGKLPWKWLAIESIVNKEFTSASDVWAYGVVLWEIGTLGGFPYPLTANEGLLEHLQKGYRLECPDNCSREVYEIMLDCWSENPADRPTFTQLRDKFDAILLAENNDMYIQFSSIDTDTPSGYDHLAPVTKEVKHLNAENKSSVLLGYDHLVPVMNEVNHPEGGTEISSITFGDHDTSGYHVGEPLDSATYANEPFRVHLGSSPNPYVKTPKNISRFNLEELGAGETLSG